MIVLGYFAPHVVRNQLFRMAIDSSLLEALTASLASESGNYLTDTDATAPKPLSQFSSEKNSIYVIYTASGFPISLGSISDGPKKRGRQGPPSDVAMIRSTVPNAIYCSVAVGNSELAENLVRLMRQLFGHTLLLNSGSVSRASGDAPKRRGRPPGAKGKRGRPAKSAGAAEGVKRGPGRPRKIHIADGVSVAKRGPGRPTTNPAQAIQPPKKKKIKKGNRPGF